jgi:hypothetical protein
VPEKRTTAKCHVEQRKDEEVFEIKTKPEFILLPDLT